jgi:glycosyltransferase involved in cell wall biosynthesis
MAAWQERVDTLRPRPRDLDTIGAVLRAALRYRAVVLDGSARRDQVAAALLGRLPRHPAIVIADSTWKSDTSGLDRLINRAGIRVIDGPRTTFCVLSRFEAGVFPRTWDLRSSRVCFTPWPHVLTESELERPVGDNGRVFAGGNSLRDYGPLIAAAAEIGAPIDIATSTLSAEEAARCPENVTVAPVARSRYDELMLAASVVVVPLQFRHDRGAGQTTYVNAMALGKALVVTDTPGVGDYIEDGRTGVIVAPGDSAGLARAVRRLLDAPEERARMGREARIHARGRLSLTDYARALLNVVDLTLASPAPHREGRPANGY